MLMVKACRICVFTNRNFAAVPAYAFSIPILWMLLIAVQIVYHSRSRELDPEILVQTVGSYETINIFFTFTL